MGMSGSVTALYRYSLFGLALNQAGHYPTVLNRLAYFL